MAREKRSLPLWLRLVVWLAVFLSPSVYFLLLTFWSKLQLPIPPVSFVLFLFAVIPVVALLVCEFLVWRKKMAVGWRIGSVVLTVMAMALQVGVLLIIIRAILVATIS